MARLTQDRRVHPRMSVIWQSMITTADLRIRCRVLNVSDSGAMVQSEERIESQEPIILKIGNGTPQFCEAVWTDSGYLGGAVYRNRRIGRLTVGGYLKSSVRSSCTRTVEPVGRHYSVR